MSTYASRYSEAVINASTGSLLKSTALTLMQTGTGAPGVGTYVTTYTDRTKGSVASSVGAVSTDANGTLAFYADPPTSGGVDIYQGGSLLMADVRPVSDAANASSLVVWGGVFDVTASPYSADKTGATDVTAAVQSAITAAIAAGGGTVFFPRGLYLFSAAPTTGTSNTIPYAGQILLPARDLTVGPMTVRLLGETPSPLALWGPQIGDDMPVEVGGSILKSTATSGNLLDCLAANYNAAGYFTNINLIAESLTIRCPNDPHVGGLNLLHCASACIRDTTIGVNASAGTISQPTGSVIGLALPGLSNQAQVSVHRSQVYGFPVALTHSEHAVLDEFVAYLNLVGIKPGPAYHLANYNRVGLYENAVHIQGAGFVSGQAATLFGTISTEQGTSGHWYSTQKVIDDPQDMLQGRLGWHAIQSAVGVGDNLLVNGAELLALSKIKTDAPSSLNVAAISASMTVPNSATCVATADTGHPSLVWGNSAVWGTTSNRAYNVAGNNDCKLTWKSSNLTPTVTASVTTSPTASRTQAGLVVQFADDNNFFSVEIQKIGTDQVVLNKKSGGSWTTAGTASPVLATNTEYTLQAIVSATQIIVKLNGATQITYTKSGGEQSAYNGNFRHGLFTYRSGGANDDGGSRWRNVTIV